MFSGICYLINNLINWAGPIEKRSLVIELSELLKLLFQLTPRTTQQKKYDFTAQLLGNAYDVDKAVPAVDVLGFSDDKLRRLFNGSRKLSQRDAKAMLSTFDVAKCSRYITQNMDATVIEALAVQLEIRIGSFEEPATEKYAQLLYDAISARRV